jgi:non-lysosomal glucosylceramidase
LGSCTHVWNYEQATGFLFGDLSKTMREVEFKYATRDDGFMPFRIHLPLDRASDMGMAAADGQMGCVMKLYRDWQLSGDDAMLHALWPKARKALEFAWIPGGWDADQDGVMEGCQHNTTDLEFYGPNPLMAGWYLGALRAAEEMALYVGEVDFAGKCRDLFTRGGLWVDANLFNGEFYAQEVRPPKGKVAKGLAGHMLVSDRNLADPPQQMGRGCMSDQLVGQFMAYVCGMGPLLKRGNMRKTLRSIMKHNFLKDQFNHANTMRAFTVNEEQMLVYGTYPRGGRPERPCFRFASCPNNCKRAVIGDNCLSVISLFIVV